MDERRLRELAREMMDGQSSLCRYYGREVMKALRSKPAARPVFAVVDEMHQPELRSVFRAYETRPETEFDRFVAWMLDACASDESGEVERRILEQQGDG